MLRLMRSTVVGSMIGQRRYDLTVINWGTLTMSVFQILLGTSVASRIRILLFIGYRGHL